MNDICAHIEALLFLSGKPVSRSVLSKTLQCSRDVVEASIRILQDRFNTIHSGIHLVSQADEIEFVTNPDLALFLSEFFKKERTNALTKPSLETLTVIAYRGPVTRPELEQIRGVNCSLILRNLMIRGLITEEVAPQGFLPVYVVTPAFLEYLGLHSLEELPQYADFHHHGVLSFSSPSL